MDAARTRRENTNMKNNGSCDRRTRLAVFPLPLAFLIVLGIGQPSFAQPHSGQFYDAGFDVTLDFLCAFDVRVIVTGSGKDITRPGDHTLSIFPGEHATVQNLSNGHSVALNVPGSFHETTMPDGSVVTTATGRNLLFDPLEAGFVLAIGSFTFVQDASGNPIQPLRGTGQLVDVCGLIQ
jgi:hypothetical protein